MSVLRSIRFPDATFAALKDEAARKGTTVNQLVLDALLRPRIGAAPDIRVVGDGKRKVVAADAQPGRPAPEVLKAMKPWERKQFGWE